MALSAGPVVVKAGYWFFGTGLNRQVADIPSECFTHLYAGFAVVNVDTGGVTFPPEFEEQFQTFPRTVRQRNSAVKALLSIGGLGSDISQVVRDEAKRKKFRDESRYLATKFGFDGLDLCWLYPSKADLKKPLASLLIEWRSTLVPYNLLLTAAVFHHPSFPVIDGTFNYPIKDINENLDWINVLAIDFYTPSNSPGETGPVHAWNTRSDPRDRSKRCGSDGIQEWINSWTAVTKKLVLGLAFHGYEWSLKDKSDYGFFAPTNAADESAAEAYRTIQAKIRENSFDTAHSCKYVATYSHNNDGIWIGYDDIGCISSKVTEAIGNKYNLGGYFAWHVDEDDENWTLSRAAFRAANAVNPY